MLKTIVQWLLAQSPELQQALQDLGWSPPQVEPKGGGPTNPTKPV